MRHSRKAIGPCVALALAGTAAAQSPLLTVSGEAAGERFGGALAVVGDLDGDGVDELLVGSAFGGAGAGSVRLVHGASGTTLWQVLGPSPGARLGASVCALNDLDGDGRPEVAAGAPFANLPGKNGAGLVRVLSGASGATLREHGGDSAGDHLGWAVASLGDVDGDGLDELAVGAIDDDDAGSSSGGVRVLRGSDGSLLARRAGSGPQELFGHALASLPDRDGDGVRELLVGAPGFGGGPAPGRARLLSGATLAPLAEWTGAAAGDTFGWAVDAVGDVDGDGVWDLVVGARQPTAGSFGYARVLSGAGGHVVLELLGDAQHARWGSAVAGLGDVDNDGHPDLAIASPDASAGGLRAGAVRVHSGRDGALVWERHGAPGSQLGAALARGELSGDRHPDLVVGAPFDSSVAPSAGLALALRGSDSPLPEEAEPAERVLLSADRELVSARGGEPQHLFLDAGREHAGRRYLFLGSASGTEPGFTLFGSHVPLVLDRYTWLVLGSCRGPLSGGRGRLDEEGRAQAAFSPPRGLARAWVGRELAHAALILGARRVPLECTNAVRVRVVP